MNIIPAIIGKDFDEIKRKISQVENLIKWVQIDVTDGVFTDAVSWPYIVEGGGLEKLNALGSIRKDDLKFEAHLMVKDPEMYLDKWIESGADRVLIHYESTNDAILKNIFDQLNDAEVEAGIVLKMETSIDVLDKFIDKLDIVQLMSITEIGAYGFPFDKRVYDKIKSLRAKYPGATIEIDGGVSLENTEELLRAGADNLVIGSAIFKSESIPSTILKFKSLKA